MVTIPTSEYFTPNQSVGPTDMNVFRDHFAFVKNWPTCRLGLASNASVSHNTWTLINASWQELEDSDNMHTGGTNYAITLQTPGVYELSVRVVWTPSFNTYSASSLNNQWSFLIAKNNAGSSANLAVNTYIQDTRLMSNVSFSGDTGDTVSMGLTDYIVSNGGDTVELWVRQFTTGGSITMQGNATAGRTGGQATVFSAKMVSIL